MSASDSQKKSKGREWAPRIWEGCSFPSWVRLLLRNRAAVHLPHWYIAAIVSFVSMNQSVLGFFDEMFFRHRVHRTKIRHDPLFILGHWRSGTTLLHELLILDQRHSFPNTYQCLEPNHFLLTESVLSQVMGVLLPSRRPMDNMAAGFDRPQEDEFAMCLLGAPSPYLTIAFPNHAPAFPEYLDMESISPQARRQWQRTFYRFVQRISCKNPKRLVLKSPPHTARIPILLEMFPKAKFVHIVRDPAVVFPSTVNMWKSMYKKHGLQTPTHAGLEDHVLESFERMYRRFEATQHLVPADQFHELKYEDLIRDPIAEMKKIYEQLQLGGYDEALPAIRAYFEKTRDYSTNKYTMDEKQQEAVRRRWVPLMQRYGYGAKVD
jgi:hypothetical protein